MPETGRRNEKCGQRKAHLRLVGIVLGMEAILASDGVQFV